MLLFYCFSIFLGVAIRRCLLPPEVGESIAMWATLLPGNQSSIWALNQVRHSRNVVNHGKPNAINQPNQPPFGEGFFHVEMIEGSLEVKLPTIWTDEKQSREEAERRERSEGKKMEMREKVGKSRNTLFFQ